MTLEDQCALSYYQEIGTLNEEKDWRLVQDRETGIICLQKKLKTYNIGVYRTLQAHPVANTPRIYLVIEDGGTLIVVEEYLNGITLKDYLSVKGTISQEEAAAIAEALCRILHQLHGMNPPIIHRDIKPSNVMITDAGVIKLLDMNAAREFHGVKGTDTSLLGTAGFAAPEQYGFGSSDPRTDLYAVGVLLNVMLTGELPAQCRAKGPLRPIIDRCLQMEPSARWQTARELEEALRRALPQSQSVRIHPAAPARPSEASMEDPEASSLLSKSAPGTSGAASGTSGAAVEASGAASGASGSSVEDSGAPGAANADAAHSESAVGSNAGAAPSESAAASNAGAAPSESAAGSSADKASGVPEMTSSLSESMDEKDQRNADLLYPDRKKERRARRAAANVSVRRFLPPGFRTGKIWKMAVATITYLVLIWLSASLEVDSNPIDTFLYKFIFLCIGLFFIFFNWNYMGMKDHFPLSKSRNVFIRAIGIVLWNILIPFLLMLLLAFIEIFMGW